VVGLVLVAVAGVLLVLFAADRLVKARGRARWRRQMTTRLAQATARADQQQQRRQASVQASKAVTSVMPAISRPPMSPPGGPPGRPKRRGGNEHTGPNAGVASHPGGRSTRGSEHPGRSADRP
jgi:Flp pilus assembly protein TadB